MMMARTTMMTRTRMRKGKKMIGVDRPVDLNCNETRGVERERGSRVRWGRVGVERRGRSKRVGGVGRLILIGNLLVIFVGNER